MDDLYPYQQLTQDPCTSTMISWWDVDTERAGSDYSFEYREKDKGDYKSVSNIDKQSLAQMPDTYRYTTHITNLRPGKVYEGNIILGEHKQKVYFKTLPSRLWRRELTFVTLSDIHIDRQGTLSFQIMTNATEMEQLRSYNPDALLLLGDMCTSVPGNTASYYDPQTFVPQFFREHLQILHDQNGEKWLVPFLWVPGNHEVAYRTPSQQPNDPVNNFMSNLMSNLITIEPINQNYSLLSIPKILDIFVLDFFAGDIDDQQDFIAANIKNDLVVNLCCTHQPILRGGNRAASDNEASEIQKQKWLPHFLKTGISTLALSGHVHVRKVSEPIKFVSTDPGGTNKQSFDTGGFMTKASSEEHHYREFGDGYNMARTAKSIWYLDISESQSTALSNFGVIKISTETITYTTQFVNSQNTETFTMNPNVVKFISSNMIQLT